MVVKNRSDLVKNAIDVVKVVKARHIQVETLTVKAAEQSEQPHSKRFLLKVSWEDHLLPRQLSLGGYFYR